MCKRGISLAYVFHSKGIGCNKRTSFNTSLAPVLRPILREAKEGKSQRKNTRSITRGANTSPTIQLNGIKRYKLNVRAVWGPMATCGEEVTLNSVLSTMNSAVLSHNDFTKLGNTLVTFWKLH